jgi:RHS repeat-associated protein
MHQMFAKLPDYDNDGLSDLYNTLNRHYTPAGRWLSPDPGGLKAVRLDDPQTWNMYAYARNNPTTLTDPTGLVVQGQDPQGHAPYEPSPKSVAMESSQEEERQKQQQALTSLDVAWSTLSSGQQALVQGGEQAWNSSDWSATQRANFAAITHALEGIDLGNGVTGLSEVKSASMKSETEMKVTWQKGAADAFESHGFSGRPGLHLGANLGPTGEGDMRLHLVFGGHSSGEVHIDYRDAFKGEGHYKPYNDDVTARPGPERSRGVPINNYERYKSWYGPLPGYNP